MKPFRFTKYRHQYLPKIRRQRGDFLIEAIIGLVLMASVGMGVVYITSRVEVSKRDMSVQDMAITQMRELLMKNGASGTNLCANSTTQKIKLPGNNNVPVTVAGCSPTSKVMVNGVEVTGVQKPIVLSIETTQLGKISVGGVQSSGQ